MNANELRDKTPDQLREELASLKKEQFNLRFQAATGQIENPARMKTVRRNVARANRRCPPALRLACNSPCVS